MFLKLHISHDSKIVALSDEDLIGKIFETKDIQLNISEYFYKDKILPEEEILKIISDANSINAVGKETIEFLIKNEIVEKENIIKIENIPHAIVILK